MVLHFQECTMQNYHVKPHDGHWDLTLGGADRACISKPTKEERTHPRSSDARELKA